MSIPRMICTNALSRYRKLYGFGAGTIRQFLYNVSELKKPQARDYEDILQVSAIVRHIHYPCNDRTVLHHGL
jgi:hypothetical protein